jgi:multidrug efflux pump subunit AcrA (membrane-fusion protein)
MTITVSATGSTDALRTQTIVSPVSGKVVGLPYLEGSPVRADNTVALIETRESQSAIAGAEALVRSATTARQKEESLRMKALAESSRTVLPAKALFDGIIGKRAVMEGDLIAEGSGILTIVDPSSICFNADVPLSELHSIHTGQECRIRLQSLPARELHAKVDAILPQSDPASQSVKVRMKFEGDADLQRRSLSLGMAGEVQIIVGRHVNVLVVPRAALLRDDENDAYSVVTITHDSLSRIIPINAIAVNESLAEVEGDQLTAGIEVVTEGNYALPDSTRITIVR